MKNFKVAIEKRPVKVENDPKHACWNNSTSASSRMKNKRNLKARDLPGLLFLNAGHHKTEFQGNTGV
jgi:hypothetical protein